MELIEDKPKPQSFIYSEIDGSSIVLSLLLSRPHFHSLTMRVTTRIRRITIAIATWMCKRNHSSVLSPTTTIRARRRTTTKMGIKNWESPIKRKIVVYCYLFRVEIGGGGGD